MTDLATCSRRGFFEQTIQGACNKTKQVYSRRVIVFSGSLRNKIASTYHLLAHTTTKNGDLTDSLDFESRV